jgi:hypothetical protein
VSQSLGVALLGWIAAAAIGLLLALDTAKVLRAFGLRVIDDDLTIFAYAAEEFLHLHVREPFFYGQAYFTLIESLPAAALVRLGVSPFTAVSLAMVGFGVAPWVLLAFAAWRRSSPVLGVALLATPLILPIEYTMLLDYKGYSTGVLVATVGIVVGYFGAAAWRGYLMGLLTGAAILIFNPNSAILALPALTVVAFERRGSARFLVSAAAGMVSAFVSWELMRAFYQVHPGWVLVGQFPIVWAWPVQLDGIQHLDRFLRIFSPWFLPFGGFSLVALVALCVAAIYRRRWSLALAAGLGLVGIVVSLGITKVHDGQDDVFFPYQRMYVAVPLLLGFLLLALWRPSRIWPGWYVAIILIAAVSFTFREASLPQAMSGYAHTDPTMINAPRTVDSLRQQCAHIDQVATEHNAGLVVHTADRGAAYACGAMMYGRVETLHPPVERRTWLLEQEAVIPRSTVVFAEVPSDFCARASSRGLQCEPIRGDPMLAVVNMPPQPALPVIRQLGIEVRPF